VEVRIPMAAAVAVLKSTLRLVFETEPAGAHRPVFPVWGDPTILIPVAAMPPAKRNVILISLDTLRADRLAAYGAFPTNAPHLDRLADEGTVFLSAFAAAPWTLPSHMTMLTGVRGCVHGRGVRWDPLGAGISPIAEILRQHNYSTAAFTEDVYLTPIAFQRGFGVFDAYTSPTTWGAKGDVERTVDRARTWLEQHADEPFFLFVHTYQVHAPYQAPPPFGDLLGGRRDDDLVSRPPEVQAWQDLVRYDEEVRYTDSVLAALFETLDRLDLTAHTIVVVTSDHGEAFGEHGHFGHTRTLDEEVIHVPFIWRAPGLIASGRRSPVVAGLADIVPTVLDLLQLPIPLVARDGSLAAFLRDVEPPLADAATRVVYSEKMLGSTYPIVVRGHNWRAEFGRGPLGEIFFVSGGHERRVAANSPTVQAAMAARARYETDCKRFVSLAAPAPVRPVPHVPSPDQLRALRALGYIQ
jgi:arylsulfatase A-like enzyme